MLSDALKGPHAKRMEDQCISETCREFAENWLTETPTLNYSLAARDERLTMVQFLEVTLREFEALKRYLAEMRGLVAPLPEYLRRSLGHPCHRSVTETEPKP